MKVNATRYLTHRDCPFTLHGDNLAEMRRATLSKLANALNLKFEEDPTKNDLLHAIIPKLKAMGVEGELADFLTDNQD